MKFAKELDDDLVPEWRAKYLNYKGGKKKIKAVARAFRNANSTPKSGGARSTPRGQTTPHATLPYTHYDFNQRGKRPQVDNSGQTSFENERENRNESLRPDAFRRQSLTMFAKSPPAFMPESRPDSGDETSETQPLNVPGSGEGQNGRHTMRYGSIIGSPPYADSTRPMPKLALPDPAMSATQAKRKKPPPTPDSQAISPQAPPQSQPPTDSPDPYHVGPDQGRHKFGASLPRHLFQNKRTTSTPNSKNTFPQSKLRRMFSSRGLESPAGDLRLGGYRELDEKQDEFFTFLDKELQKIESFYMMKEDEATDRLNVLRQQLHELRDQRMEDIRAAKRGMDVRDETILHGLIPITPLPTAPFKDETANGNGHAANLLKPFENVILRNKTHIGKTSEAMENLGSPPHPKPKKNEDQSDFTRKRHANDKVPYRFAKRRLKLALQEFYRGLELLKSYVLLNRTGFRKINKKYDKAVNARPTGRYMSEKVNQAHFVQSNIIEGHIVAVEDLYSRYFERGNHKIAVGKLRTQHKTGDQAQTSFRNGLFVAAGIISAIQGLIGGAQHLRSSNPTIATQASYLLQLYAGYFLIDLLFVLFTLNCKVWTAARINYVFVFEYDARHVLDWRQLAELPCFFMFLNGFFLWLNFRSDANGNVVDAMYLYYPLCLIVITLIIMCLPLPIIYHKARIWWGFSNWRLLLAGLYPVEFRDFYLGDMYCSETYAMSQVEVFFCLYAHGWRDPPQCNSNHSRLLGFLTTLPAIWRAFQCLRRFYDSRNWFPHLANFAKYCGNILYYMSLSMYRIDKSTEMRAMFIVFAIINGVYCSFWDVAMDFSLGNPWAKHRFLRETLGFRRVWVYYFAAGLDVLLRQQWIFYVLYTHDLQHSAFLSFAVALAEVLRRGMWSLFRVENEHCNNVGKFRASRDIPLPYSLPESQESLSLARKKKAKDAAEREGSPEQVRDRESADVTGADVERSTEADPTLRQRRRQPPLTPSVSATPGIRALQRVGTVIAAAHAQDFTKKKQSEMTGSPGSGALPHGGNDSSDEDDDEDDGGVDSEGLDLEREDGRLGESEEDVMEAQRMISRGQG